MSQLNMPGRVSDVLSLRSFREAPVPSVMQMARQVPADDKDLIPHPSHRHASPSAPWPWVDLADDVDKVQLEYPLPPIPPICDHKTCDGCYVGYPQSCFPNWTHPQVVKSKIYDAIYKYDRGKKCILHRVDVDSDGYFNNPGPIVASLGQEVAIWDQLINEERPEGIRVRAMFIENMSGPILQMLGAKYNIEPFFWSSSLSWIPSRFQEEVQPGIGDQITLVMPFLRAMPAQFVAGPMNFLTAPRTLLGSETIDPYAPLDLYSNGHLLALDLLAVHLIRNKYGSTLISFHPSANVPTTTAPYLHERIHFVGQNVYWQSIFQKSEDPTFLLLPYMWHAMYAWDEALEKLYAHICHLETRVISAAVMPLPRELHIIRAHYLQYTSLLDNTHKHIIFIRATRNPVMDNIDINEHEHMFGKALMERECENLLAEVERLKNELHMQERRLENVMSLTDSRYVREMTEVTIRDSAAMKQIAYLTMVFLPASFVAGIFGMNVKEINPGTFGTLATYVAIAAPLTIITIWVIIAFQIRDILPESTGFFKRLSWPVYLAAKMMKNRDTAKIPGQGRYKESSFDYDYESQVDIQSRSCVQSAIDYYL